MKKILILLCVFLTYHNCYPQKNAKDNIVSLGLKTGLNHSTFIYTATHLKSLPNKLFIQPNIGLFAEFHINNNISISPEFSFSSKGNLTTYTYENMYDVIYRVKTKYISTKLSVYYYFFTLKREDIFPYCDTSNDIHFFIVAAPCLSNLLGGNIALTQPGLPVSDISINVGNANMNNIDVGVYLGSGIYIPISAIKLKIELGYNLGLLNSYSKMEINEISESTNINAYNLIGKRYNHGLELNISLGLKLNNNNDGACRMINKMYYHKNRLEKTTKNQHKKFLNTPY